MRSRTTARKMNLLLPCASSSQARITAVSCFLARVRYSRRIPIVPAVRRTGLHWTMPLIRRTTCPYAQKRRNPLIGIRIRFNSLMQLYAMATRMFFSVLELLGFFPRDASEQHCNQNDFFSFWSRADSFHVALPNSCPLYWYCITLLVGCAPTAHCSVQYKSR